MDKAASLTVTLGFTECPAAVIKFLNSATASGNYNKLKKQINNDTLKLIKVRLTILATIALSSALA